MASNTEQTVHQRQHDCQNLLSRVTPRRSIWRFGIVMLLGLFSFVCSVSAQPKVYSVDAARSALVVQLFKAGIGGPLAHDHVVRATQFTGQIQADLADPTRSAITIEVQTPALQADEPTLRQKY